MNPLDTARRLARQSPVADHDFGAGCQFCSGRAELPYGGDWQIDHKPSCPWLALPRIVAVLEAVEAYVQEMEGQGERVDVFRRIQTYRALVTALRGEPE